MGMGTRELLLIIRGQDELSKVLRGVGLNFTGLSTAAQQAAQRQIALGSAVSTVGLGMAAVGGAALKWLGDAVDYTKTFQNQVALVKTQVDDVKVSQQQLAEVSMSVAKNIAVPLDTLNASLYDIFSSMDVTVPQAQQLLTGFAKSAVAGQVDVQTAGRATIAIMNAWHLPIDDVNHILDVQFELVKKGVGTYQEFASTIGQAIPSAQRAGQSIETLAGMMAYLTRNGLSASMASASAQRALDAFANPKVQERLTAMGIAVTDSSGNFRDFSLVIADLQKKLADMTQPQRAAALQALFVGAGGTIQARRFYDTVLESSTAVQQYTGLVNDMKNSSGALDQAYGTMSNSVATKTQLLTNQYDLLKVSVGNALIPVLTFLIPLVQKVLTWWNNLGEGTQKTVVIIVAITAALFTLGGIIMFIVGTMIMMAGAATLLGISLGSILLTVGLVVIGLAALVAIAVLVYKNWDTISSAIKAVWVPVVHALGDAWNWLLHSVLEPVYKFIADNIGSKLVALWKQISTDVGNISTDIGNKIHDAIGAVTGFIGEMWKNIDDWTKEHWGAIQDTIKIFTDWFAAVWPYLKWIITTVLNVIVGIFQALWGTIVGIWHGIWTIIVGVLKGAWNTIADVVRGIIDIIEGILGFIIDVFTGRWSNAWKDILKILEGIWEIIRGVFIGAWDIIVAVFEGAWFIIAAVATGGWNSLVALFKGAAGIIRGLWDAMIASIEQAWKELWNNGILAFFNYIKDALVKSVGQAGKELNDAWNHVLNELGVVANAIIEVVYNGGIRPVWNNVVDYVGLKNLELPLGHLIDTQDRATGGPITGPGGPMDDKIWARLSNGEFVVRAEQTSKWRPFLEMINSGKVPGFASGGAVNANVGKVLQFANTDAQSKQHYLDPYGSAMSILPQTQAAYGMAGAGLSMVNKTADYLINKLAQGLSAIGTGISNFVLGQNTATGSIGVEQQYAASQLNKFGWNLTQMPALIALWNKESGWNPNAVNPSSGAYGIPQALGHGHPYNLGDYMAQINWGMLYIAGRYGSPLAAWAHEVANNWYDIGGVVPRGTSIVNNGTSGNEHLGILTTTQWNVLHQLANGHTINGGSQGNTYNITVQGINIYTNEIDPEQHARELGAFLTKGGVM